MAKGEREIPTLLKTRKVENVQKQIFALVNAESRMELGFRLVDLMALAIDHGINIGIKKAADLRGSRNSS